MRLLFRGARSVSQESITTGRRCSQLGLACPAVAMDSGLSPAGCPGMTAVLICLEANQFARFRVFIAPRCATKRLNRLRQNIIFSSCFGRLGRSSRRRKNISIYENQKVCISSLVPCPIQRGASRSSRTLGAGCDGRGGHEDERG
jgi:hypothetical protein